MHWALFSKPLIKNCTRKQHFIGRKEYQSDTFSFLDLQGMRFIKVEVLKRTQAGKK